MSNIAPQNLVCYRTFHLEKPWSIESYKQVGGYSVWKDVVSGKITPEQVIQAIKESMLMGRGGAGFPTGLKMSFVNRNKPGQKYLVCNSDESEPGTSKDRFILSKNPHQLIEGMAIAAYTMGATVAYNYMRGEFMHEYNRCEAALKEAINEGLIGENVLGSKITIHIHNLIGAGAYIVGEETAMLESLEGKRAMPRYKPPFPANFGLYGKPTTVNNTESIASIPVVLEKGGKWFNALGTEKSGGTKIFSVSGHIEKPGVFEVPMGIPFKDLLALCGGMRRNRGCKAVIPGGSSMKIVPGDLMMKAEMSYEGMKAVNSAIGSGGVIVMDDHTCMVEALTCVVKFYRDESCGQCTPCREGTGWLHQMLCDISAGRGKPGDVDRLVDVANKIEGKTICAFGEAVAWPVQSFVEHFRDEFEYYCKHGHSKVKGIHHV
ncbi:MAG: NADH-quinone oxidoreductase subunit F [Gammaproteobacteria bacterium TMED281]|nr:MAG: NADH-quinone oxidoreductase subunit F [Gammaproteobacteria bacterium TMED281]